ncbi:hypothetical protein CB1_000155024 [Camelus ferus]|nr:hypothetical protein CB1_000155024 [Camelus ferus]
MQGSGLASCPLAASEGGLVEGIIPMLRGPVVHCCACLTFSLLFFGLHSADDVMPATYCEIDLDKEKRDAFVYAIKNHYWYQMYIDDLPIWGIVGEADENGEDYYLWTYKKLEIGFNGNRIVDVNLTSEGKVKLVPNTKIQMSYSIRNDAILKIAG